MDPEEEEVPAAVLAASTWQATLFLGVVTVILGLIVSFRPSGSLAVIAVLIGILMIISGIFHLIRVFDRAERHRVWLGIAGLLYVVIGVLLIRHLNLTVAFIGLVVGLTWIVSGLSALMSAGSGLPRGAWLVDLLRHRQPDRRDHRGRRPHFVGDGARHPARDLVHRHRPLRGHRGLHDPAGRFRAARAAAHRRGSAGPITRPAG